MSESWVDSFVDGPVDETAGDVRRRTQNAPGLPALSYRVGTHGTITAALHEAVSATPVLHGLTTRELDDPSIALLDGAAAVLDVLTFYSERIANEGYLRTATELDSVRALASEIGYELTAGVAATTYLAFTMDAIPGGPVSTMVRAGTRAQSVPGQDEKPQVFETTHDLEAQPGWNAIQAKSTQPEVLRTGLNVIHLLGTSTGLRVGDRLALVGPERQGDPTSDRWDVRRVARLSETPGPEPSTPGVTVVWLDAPLGSLDPSSAPAGPPAKVYAFRDHAALFGHNAMRWRDLPLALRVGELPPGGGNVITGPYAGRERSWADARLPIGTTEIDLERTVPGVVSGSWIVLTAPGKTAEQPDAELFQVVGVTERSVADYLLTAKVTTLTISGEHISYFTRRSATVLCVSEELALADKPIDDPVAGYDIDLVVPAHLPAERTVAVTGVPVGSTVTEAEVASVRATSGTTVHLREALTRRYQRHTVVVRANVVAATHGEARTRVQPEILGSGDARQAFQSFALRASPLTYTATADVTGARSSLTVRVDGLAWHQVATLYGEPPDARVYVLRNDEGGRAVVSFGDGLTGSRLPTGTNNVTADYRVGIGLEAMLDRGRLSLLLDRPLGLTEVVNPVPSLGAADPENLADARANAPSTVVTLGRVVSLADYEAFVRAFPGVGKASAVALWHAAPGQRLSAGEQRVVHVTVATAAGAPLARTDPLHAQLGAAVDAARHPSRPVVLDGYVAVPFTIAVALRLDPDLVADVVRGAAQQLLSDHFGFAHREFGQDVTAAEVLAVAQRAPGVLGVTLDALHTGGQSGVQERIEARPARVEHGVFALAELVTVGSISVREVSP